MDTGKIIVFAWVKVKEGPTVENWVYEFVWSGSSMVKAIWHAWVAKGYSGCVKIEWRGVR